jgi:hypothetical protein
MEDVLEQYAKPHDPQRPVVCFDESPTQRIGEFARQFPRIPASSSATNYEDRRNGTVNLLFSSILQGPNPLDVHPRTACVKMVQAYSAPAFPTGHTCRGTRRLWIGDGALGSRGVA